MNNDPRKVEPKDVFFHLLSMVMLYASAISFLTLIFQSINIWLPDTLSWYGYGEVYRGPLRFAIASLFVVFPVYYFSARFLKRVYESNPEKSELRIRKWLVYLTLFIAALVIIGDLVALINNFLSGELSLRFLLKVLAVLFVAGATFGYYLQSLKDSARPSMKLYTVGVPVVVLIFFITGVVAVGSPVSERDRQYDERRVNDLQYLQTQLNEYYAKTKVLPKSLPELEDPVRGVSIPRDPETGEVYLYEVGTSTSPSFKLCAVFKRSSLINEIKTTYPGDLNEFWKHDAGEECFSRVIDTRFITRDSSDASLKATPIR